MGVVVIVPAFAIANQAYEYIVTAILVRLVIPVAPQVRDRVYRPGDVPHCHRPHKDAPYQKTCPELNRLGRMTAHEQCGNKAAREKQQPGHCNDEHPKAGSLKSLVKFVAENVFRVGLARAQGSEIVVFDQEPAEMAPKKAHPRTVRIRLIIGVLMVTPMSRDPPCRRVLQTAYSKDCEAVFKPFRADKPTMRQQSMIAKVDPQRSEDVQPEDCKDDARPTVEPWKHCEQRDQMTADDTDGVEPSDTERASRGGHRELGRFPARGGRNSRLCQSHAWSGAQRVQPIHSLSSWRPRRERDDQSVRQSVE